MFQLKCESHISNIENKPQPSQVPLNKITDHFVKTEPNNTTTEGSDSGNNPSSSDCDSNDGILQIKGKKMEISCVYCGSESSK